MANNKGTAAGGSGNDKSFSFAVAKVVLSDTEKDRCLCLFLNSDHKTIDWAKATRDFNCASIDSMRVMTRGTLKKITDAEKNGGTLPGSGSKAKGAGGGRKRNAPAAAAAAAAAAEDGDDDGTPTPAAKKGKKGGKKADTPVEDDDESKLKNEGEDESEDAF